MKNYPIIKVAIFFSGGILLSRLIELDVTQVYILILVFLLISLLFFKYKSNFTPLTLLILIFLIGYLQVSNKSSAAYIFPQDIYRVKDLTVFGKVTDIQLIKTGGFSFYFETDSLTFNEKSLKRKVNLLCKIQELDERKLDSIYNALQPGNYLKLTGIYYKGREMRNPGEFDYNKYLNSAGISGIFNISNISNVITLNTDYDFFKSLIFSIRKYLDKEIKTYHSKETASLLKGLLLSDRSEIDYVTKTQFINAGVIHILAVSGLHVGFVAVVFIFLFGRFNIYLRTILTITGLLLFMFITGVPPSVFRATLMAVIILITFITNRSTNLFNSLALAALIILIIKPDDLFNPGFQLSFSAVLGIAILTPPIEKVIKKIKIKSKFLKYLLLFMAVSLGAQIGTLPFTLIYFGKLSVIALIANLFAIPLAAVIVSLGIFTLIIGSIFPFIAVYYGLANNLFSNLLFSIVKFSGSLEFSYLSIKHFTIYDAILFYIFLFLLFYSIKKIKINLLKSSAIILIIINFLIFTTFDNQELIKNDKLTIIVIDVGQGDAILIKFPKGTTALIDAGNVTPFFDNGERIILPLLEYLGIDKIDYGFVSHIDSDHYAGFVSLINAGVINRIYKPEIDTSLSKDIRFETYLKERNIPCEYYKKSKTLIDEVPLYILTDEKISQNYDLSSNDRSGVIKIVYGNNSFLFTGDIEKDVEKIYASNYKQFMDTDFLKASHHGSKTGSTPEFLRYVTPKQSIISAGLLNSFGHPSNEVLIRLENFGSEIYRTDKYGALIFESDGDSIRFIDWKMQF